MVSLQHMMQWVDLYAAPCLVLLLLAAVGGFFVHERRCLPVPSGYAGLSLAAAWRWGMACIALAVAMAWMVWSIAQGGANACSGCVDWHLLDARAQAWVHTQAHATWIPWVAMFTHLGHLVWMAALGVVASMWLLHRRAWLLLGAWVVGVAGVGLWVRWIKHSVARDRPEVRWVLEQGFSFPSGHSAGTLVCYGMLAWMVFVMCGPRAGRWATALAVFVVFAVGCSRVVLGAHYVSDVVAGWILGLAWMSAVFAIATVAQHRAQHRTCS